MLDVQRKEEAAVRYTPQEMPPLQIKHFLERAWIPWSAIRRWRRPWMPDEWMPDMDIFERDGKLVIRADLRRVERDDVGVSVEGETDVAHDHRERREGGSGQRLPLQRAACWNPYVTVGSVRRHPPGSHRGHI
jgi:HSP20 family molecular chaperone IbpA